MKATPRLFLKPLVLNFGARVSGEPSYGGSEIL